jgi:hypothetical protein
MPEYSVAIKLNGHDPVQIARRLEAAFGSVVAEEAKITVWGQPNFYEDPCKAMGHFGCVHWTDDDLEGRFQRLNIAVTPELLTEVKERVGHIDDGMVELGWEAIESAIVSAAELAAANL